MAKKKCEICGKRDAVVPDRNKIQGRLINRICEECHRERLKKDIVNVIAFTKTK